jgi:hypothetical protein
MDSAVIATNVYFSIFSFCFLQRMTFLLEQVALTLACFTNAATLLFELLNMSVIWYNQSQNAKLNRFQSS